MNFSTLSSGIGTWSISSVCSTSYPKFVFRLYIKKQIKIKNKKNTLCATSYKHQCINLYYNNLYIFYLYYFILFLFLFYCCFKRVDTNYIDSETPTNKI